MRAVVQRVRKASVEVAGEIAGEIDRGLCVFVGVERGDDPVTAHRLAAKLAKLRIFEDDAGKMNLSVQDVRGALLVISQFTLAADTSEGNRPSFTAAAPPAEAEPLYELVVGALREQHGLTVATGRFRTSMLVRIENDGPVTIPLQL